MNKKIGLLFDMDGVIINNHTFHFKAWQKICEKYGKPLSPDQYRDNMNGRTLMEVVAYIMGEQLSKDETRKIGLEKEEIYRKLYQPYLQPTPGLLSFLDKAKKAGWPCIIGTSAPKENVSFTLNGLGIGHYFDAVLDDKSVTKGKPDPEIYQKCAVAAGLPNGQCVVLEDAISGIKAGLAAGSPVIGLATSHTKDELTEATIVIPDFQSLSLNDVLALIE